MANLKKQAEELGIDVDHRWSNETLQTKIAEAKAKKAADDVEEQSGSAVQQREQARPIDGQPGPTAGAANTETIQNIGVPRALTTEETREDNETAATSQAAPYPADAKEAHRLAVERSQRVADAPEFNTEDLTGASVNGEGKTDVVTIRLLYDWWDGQGVRHALGSHVDVPINEARLLVDQRKAERTDRF